jgi:uncharacterized membrane protein YphA (DoxX/SURF4 family)
VLGGQVSRFSDIEYRTRLLMAGLRVFMGLLFIAVWSSNLRKGLYGDEFVPFVQGWADATDVTFYGDFIERVVIPNATFFSTFQLIVEFVVMGVFLVVGFITPVSAIVAAAFSLNLLLASVGTNEWPGTYLLMIAILIAVALSQAGRVFGADGYLVRRNAKPRIPLY